MRLAVLTLGLVGCVPPVAPATAPSAPSLPFTGVTAWMSHAPSVRPPFEVHLTVHVTSSLTPADGLEVDVLDGDRTVASAPIAVELEHRCCGEDDPPADVPATVTLPALGDYRVEAHYGGKAYHALDVRIAAVPCWGGVTQAQLLIEPGSHVSLARHLLSLTRWRVEDSPDQAYRVEWLRDGALIRADQGRQGGLSSVHSVALVMDAAPPRDMHEVGTRQSLWRYGGEEYRVPDEVETPGRWTARVLREGAEPVEVTFAVAAGGALVDVDPEDTRQSAALTMVTPPAAALAGWEAALDAVPGKPEITETDIGVEHFTAPIPVSAAGARALFRSQTVYHAWRDFLSANTPTPEGVTQLSRSDHDESPEEAYRRLQRADARAEREGKADNAHKRGQAPRLRAQVLRLIQQYGGPWRPEERPR